jgi:hypothetical protein
VEKLIGNRRRFPAAAAMAAVGLATWGVSSASAVPFTGSYSENFDSIGATGTAPPTGWTVGYIGATNQDGGGAVTSDPLVVDDGSNDTVGLSFNYGTTGATDRAIGAMGTTNKNGLPNGDRVAQVELTNNTGAALTAVNVAYTGEQWRNNQGTASPGPEKIRLYYSTSPSSGWQSLGSSFEFTAPQNSTTESALDGNQPANRAAIAGQYTLPAPLADGSTFYLRWLDWNDLNTSDHGLAIDDVSVTAVPEPASAGLIGLAGLALAARRRRA